jgi:RIP metalloprotease RseP
MDALSILLAILALGFLIVVHEAGHYVVARWCKMRVERFSVGFGPGILKRKAKSGTIFQLAPLPFGGFVEIRGMNIAEEVDPEDLHAYPNRPAWQRFLTILAGPATNYISAIFLAFALYTCHGQKGDTWYVEKVNDGYDAKGKLLPNDRIIAVDGVPMFAPTSEALSGAINKKAPGKPIAITVVRGDVHHVTVTILPKLEGVEPDIKLAAATLSMSAAGRHDVYRMACQIAAFDHVLRANEVRVLDKLRALLGVPDDAAQKLETEFDLVRNSDNRPYYRIGVTQDRDYVSIGFAKAAGDAIMYPIETTKLILGGLRDIFSGKEEADPGGPVRIIGEFKSAFGRGLADGVGLLMMLSVYLGLFNLFPLPALDGGRLVFLLYEMVTRRRANPKIETMVHMGGIMVLMVVMILVTLHDFKVF